MKKIILLMVLMLTFMTLPLSAQSEQYILGEKELFIDSTYDMEDVAGAFLSGDMSGYEFQKDPYSYFTIKENKITTKYLGEGYIKIFKKDDPKYVKYVIVKVSSTISNISLDKTAISGTSGDVIDIPLSIEKSQGADNINFKELTIRSSNEDVAEIISTNQIRLKKAGQSNISISTKDGKSSLTLPVSCRQFAKSLTIEGKVINKKMVTGETLKLNVKLNGTTNNDYVVYTSSNPSSLTVSNDGTVKAIATGSAVIKAESLDGTIKDSYNIQVYSNVMSATVSKKDIKLDETKKTDKISATIKYRVTAKKELMPGYYFYSEDDNVAKVDKDGTITAVGRGKTKVYVRTDDGAASDYALVVVNYDEPVGEIEVPITKIKISNNKSSVDVGEKILLNISYEPYNTTEKEFSITLTDDMIGTIVKEGSYYYYTPTKAGFNTITVRTKDGKTAAYNVRSQSYVREFKFDTSGMAKSDGVYYRVYIGEEIPLKYQFKASSGIDSSRILYKEVEYVSYDNIIEVDKKTNTVKGIRAGKTKIMVKAIDSNLADSLYIEVVSPYSTIKTDLKENYNKGEEVKVTATGTLKNGVKDIPLNYEVTIQNQFFEKTYLVDELNHEREFIKYLQKTSGFGDMSTRILLADSLKRYEVLTLMLRGETGTYVELKPSNYLTDRKGNRIYVATINDDMLTMHNSGKLVVVTREKGSSVYTFDNIVIK